LYTNNQVLQNIFNEVEWTPDTYDSIAQLSTKLALVIEDFKRFGKYDWDYPLELNDQNTEINLWRDNGKFIRLDVSGMKPITYPEILRSLTLTGIIQIEDYNNLAQELVNLQSLRIKWLNLGVVGKPEAWTTFPELRELMLGTWEFRRGVSSYHSNY